MNAEQNINPKRNAQEATGHELVLRALRNRGAEVTIVFMSGEVMKGVIAGFDRFTVTVRAGGVRHVIFKHGVERFSASEPVYTPRTSEQEG